MKQVLLAYIALFGLMGSAHADDLRSHGTAYVPPSSSSEIDEMTPEIAARIPQQYSVAVSCESAPPLPAGSSFTLACTIQNKGIQNDTYTLKPKSSLPWVNITKVPQAVSLAGKASVQVKFSLVVPTDAKIGTTGTVELLAISQNAPLIEDQGVKNIIVASP